jgi:hypothetical protein
LAAVQIDAMILENYNEALYTIKGDLRSSRG